MVKLLHWLGMPENAAAHGAEIDHMNALVHWLMAILFVGWGIFFLYCLFRFRAKRNPRADYVGVKSHFSTWLEVGVAVIEAVLLIGFAFPIWAKVKTQLPSPEGAVEVRVVAEQFAWNIHYPGADGVFGKTDPTLVDTAANPLGLDFDDPDAQDDIYTVNELALPVDRTIMIRLSSKDVIHSFALPVMRVKQDAIPGMEIPVWFTPIRTGDWEIACAQLCGLGHYRMRGFLKILTQEGYDAWMAQQVADQL